MRKKHDSSRAPAIWALLFLALYFAAALGFPQGKTARLQREIAGKTLALRVIANSDSAADQAQKAAVRDAASSCLSSRLAGVSSRAEALRIICKERGEILRAASLAAPEASLSLSIAREWFPQRVCGSSVFPEGYYDSCCIRIGEAAGHNWWGVLYPGLCFPDSIRAIRADGTDGGLDALLSGDAFSLLKSPAARIRFYFFP